MDVRSGACSSMVRAGLRDLRLVHAPRCDRADDGLGRVRVQHVEVRSVRGQAYVHTVADVTFQACLAPANSTLAARGRAPAFATRSDVRADQAAGERRRDEQAQATAAPRAGLRLDPLPAPTTPNFSGRFVGVVTSTVGSLPLLRSSEWTPSVEVQPLELQIAAPTSVTSSTIPGRTAPTDDVVGCDPAAETKSGVATRKWRRRSRAIGSELGHSNSDFTTLPGGRS